ncbi:MAG: AMP-binding protein, partial [Pseudomonadota bacterium]
MPAARRDAPQTGRMLTVVTDAAAPEGALDTFPKLLEHNARKRGDRPASREKMFGIWQSWTWAEMRDETRAIAAGLLDLGLQPGERVAIIGKNRPKLYFAMTAVQHCDAAPVPVYKDAVGEEMAYVLNHAEVSFAVVEDQEQVDKVLAIKDQLPLLRQVIYLDSRGLRKYDHATLHELERVKAAGAAKLDALGPRIDAIVAGQKGADTCVMLYTSGTTGRSKGVVLSNDNIIVTARATVAFDKLTETDSVLAYLPMAWVGDYMLSVAQSYVAGFCVCCPESEETMMHDLK